MQPFEDIPAKSVKEACELLTRYGEEAKVLGGGQSLVNLMKQNLIFPSYIVDVKGLSELDYIRYAPSDGLRIGAVTTHRSVEKSDLIRDKYPILAQMEQTLASAAVRNWATVGGSLAHADPASDLVPALMALDARVTLTAAGGERVVSVEDFVVDYFETVLRTDELLTEIHIPDAVGGAGCFTKFALRATDLAVVSVAAWILPDDNRESLVRDARIALGAVGPKAYRSKRAESLLKGQVLNRSLIEEAARGAARDAQPTTDMNGSEEYKRQLVNVLVRRTIEEATARKGDGS